MRRVSATMSQASACPTYVLTLSTNSISFCMANPRSSKNQPSCARRMADRSCVAAASGLLRRCARLLAEVVVHGRTIVVVRVVLPLGRALGIGAHGSVDLLEHRVLGFLLGDD